MLQLSTPTPIDTWTHIINASFYFSQAVCSLYFLSCIFCWIYKIREIYFHFKQRVLVIRLSRHSANQEGFKEKVAGHDDCIVRNVVHLLCVMFEIMFSLSLNLYGVYFITTTLYLPPTSIPISRNCSLIANSFLTEYYDFRVGSVILNLLSFMKSFSFSMMLWLFSASLYNWSYAARNMLRVKILTRFVLIATLTNLSTATLAFIPYTSLFGKITQSLLDSYCVYIAFYIARNKYTLAMNSRIAEAYHHCSEEGYLKRRNLLKLNRILVFLIIASLGIYVHNNLFVFIPYAILNSISLNSCWFYVTYHIPMFELSEPVVTVLLFISNYLWLFYRFIEVFVFVCFTFLNLVNIYQICLLAPRKISFLRKNYYLHELSTSLLSNSN